LVQTAAGGVDQPGAVCFPNGPTPAALARQTFVFFAQTWLDRAWLWHAPAAWVRRVACDGYHGACRGTRPVVVFVHISLGLWTAWGGGTINRVCTTIYTDQSNKVVDAWIAAASAGNLRLFGRIDGAIRTSSDRPFATANLFYLLPDADFGPDESVSYRLASDSFPRCRRCRAFASGARR
jgi:KDO2-lipid IV(A) lauroyltransferase